MRKKKSLLNLVLLLSLGIGSFGSNTSVVVAEEPVDEIVLEDDDYQTTEILEDSSEGEEIEMESPEPESSSSITLDPVKIESDIQINSDSDQNIDTADQANGSSIQSSFYASDPFLISSNGELIRYYGNQSAVVIPNSVTSIGEDVFYGKNITSVTIPKSVKSIGAYAFGETRITEIIVPDSVEYIGEYAFLNCDRLQKITLGNGLKDIPYCFASGCPNLKTVIFGNNIRSIGQRAFVSSGLINVTIPDSVKAVGYMTFAGGNSLQKISTGTGLKYIPDGFAGNCPNLKTVNFGNDIKTIGNNAFKNSGLVNVTIPDSVESIGEGIFQDCKSLQKITIGHGLKDIPYCFASGCPELKSVVFGKNIRLIDECAFKNSGLVNITIPESVVEIGESAFKESKLKSVAIQGKVTAISAKTFENISTLRDVYLPISIWYIAPDAFNNSPDICLHLYSDHTYAINYAIKRSIPWKSRGLHNNPKPKTIKAESAGKNKVRLSWSNVSSADKYLVQCWRNGKLQYKYTTKNNYLTDPKASDTASNTYKVYARIRRPEGPVGYSNQPAVVSALGICPRVTNVRANSTTSGAQIKWNKSYYNNGYIIYRSINKNGTGAVFAGTTRDVKFTDKKAKKGQLYYYWVYPYHNKNGKMILGEKPAESPRAKMK